MREVYEAWAVKIHWPDRTGYVMDNCGKTQVFTDFDEAHRFARGVKPHLKGDADTDLVRVRVTVEEVGDANT